MTKTEIRQWLKRIREDVRDAERALQAGDLESVQEFTNDASCAAVEIASAIDGDDRGA